MPIVKISSQGQVKVPKNVLKQLNISPGDYIEFEVVEGNVVMVKPKKLINANQEWFWTKEWQEGEKEVEEDKKAGRVKEFKNAKAAVKWLKS